VHFDKLAVRLEYERFELDARPGFEPPNMISLGASWTFSERGAQSSVTFDAVRP